MGRGARVSDVNCARASLHSPALIFPLHSPPLHMYAMGKRRGGGGKEGRGEVGEGSALVTSSARVQAYIPPHSSSLFPSYPVHIYANVSQWPMASEVWGRLGREKGDSPELAACSPQSTRKCVRARVVAYAYGYDYATLRYGRA